MDELGGSIQGGGRGGLAGDGQSRDSGQPASSQTPSKQQHPLAKKNLQVALDKEIWSKKSKHSKGSSSTREQALTEELATDFKQQLPKKSFMHTSQATPSNIKTNPEVQQHKDQHEEELNKRDQLAIATMRKCHSSFDKAKREFQAMIQKSMSHANTEGCKFEKDLQGIIEKGQVLDETLLQMETKHLSHALLSNEELSEGAQACEALTALIKAGQSRASAIRGMRKVDAAYTTGGLRPPLCPRTTSNCNSDTSHI